MTGIGLAIVGAVDGSDTYLNFLGDDLCVVCASPILQYSANLPPPFIGFPPSTTSFPRSTTIFSPSPTIFPPSTLSFPPSTTTFPPSDPLFNTFLYRIVCSKCFCTNRPGEDCLQCKQDEDELKHMRN